MKSRCEAPLEDQTANRGHGALKRWWRDLLPGDLLGTGYEPNIVYFCEEVHECGQQHDEEAIEAKG